MESKYNLLTRLLKNIKNVVNPDGSVAGSGGGVVHSVISGSTATLDKTWQEIFDGDYTAIEVSPYNDSKVLLTIQQVSHEGTYYVIANGVEGVEFGTDSASGYPTATQSGDEHHS